MTRYIGESSAETVLFRGIAMLASMLLLGVLVGCGGGASSAPVAPGSSASAPQPGTTPTPAPSAASDTYMATLFLAFGNNPAPQGTVAVDATANDGRGTVQVSGASPSSSYELRFCMQGAPSPTSNCFHVADYGTDANGTATVNFQVSQKGSFTGAFFVFKDAAAQYSSGVNTFASGTSFHAVLLPVSSSTSGGGSASASGQAAHVTLNGALPNHNYQAMLCGLSSGCQTGTALATDAQGNGAADMQLPTLAFAGFFLIKDSAGDQYIAAFRVQ
jgi:hypothetical protein